MPHLANSIINHSFCAFDFPINLKKNTIFFQLQIYGDLNEENVPEDNMCERYWKMLIELVDHIIFHITNIGYLIILIT